MRRLLKKAIAKGVSFETDVQLVSAKGREYWLRTLHVPKMSNGKCIKLSGYFQDITEQVELNKKNQQVEQKFSRLIEKSTDVIILLDKEALIRYCSQSIKQTLGYTAEEIVGTSAYFFFHPDDIAQMEQKQIKILQSPGKHFPFTVDRLKHKKGHYVYVEGIITNLFDDESVRASVANFRDVTEKRSAADKLKMKNERLEQIAWLFSHQVRGPVATIIGLLNLLNHQDITDPINKEVLAKILIPAHQLDEIIAKIINKTYEIEEPLMNLTHADPDF
jgi:PAS domain S-box-containing protein